MLGRYRLQRRLGAGAFGTVWMARDERLDRDVAVKIVPRERIVGGRFEREARAAARLSHPGIVTLYEAAVDDDGAYLVSELVRGATLGRMLEHGRLSDRDIVTIAIALCDALSHAHAQGVVHRDVKPSNILVPERPSSRSESGQADRLRRRPRDRRRLADRTGDVVGTAAYMAPEQAEGREAGAPADLYSLALVTYEALTGVNPVRTGTVGDPRPAVSARTCRRCAASAASCRASSARDRSRAAAAAARARDGRRASRRAASLAGAGRRHAGRRHQPVAAQRRRQRPSQTCGCRGRGPCGLSRRAAEQAAGAEQDSARARRAAGAAADPRARRHRCGGDAPPGSPRTCSRRCRSRRRGSP